MQTFSN